MEKDVFRTKLLEHISTDTRYKSYLSEFPKASTKSIRSMISTDGEIQKYYTLDETGNILISSTTPDADMIPKDVKEVFQKVIVFFGMWTVALKQKEKTLFDAEAITSIIDNSGFFVRIHQEERTFKYTAFEGTLNLAIINSILGSFSAMGGALKIAQTVVGSVGQELKIAASKQQSTKKIGHLIFICENLMGMPIVSILLINTTANEAKTVTDSNCHSTVSENLNMTFRQDSFLFIDPTYINKFNDQFKTTPEYDELIKKLSSYIK